MKNLFSFGTFQSVSQIQVLINITIYYKYQISKNYFIDNAFRIEYIWEKTR